MSWRWIRMLPEPSSYAVEDEVVAFAADFPRRGFELFDVFFDDAGERMLRAGPGFVVRAPLKEREAGEPEKFPLRFVDQVERFAENAGGVGRRRARRLRCL